MAQWGTGSRTRPSQWEEGTRSVLGKTHLGEPGTWKKWERVRKGPGECHPQRPTDPTGSGEGGDSGKPNREFQLDASMGRISPPSLISLSHPSSSCRAPDPALGGGAGGDRGHPDLRGDRGHGGGAALHLVQERPEAPGQLIPDPAIPVRPRG